MQWDPILTQLYLLDGGGVLALLLLVPAIVLRLCAWHIERAGERMADNTHINRIAHHIKTHPRLMVGVYNVCNGGALFLITIWMMIVFGFLAAITTFFTVALVFGVLPCPLPKKRHEGGNLVNQNL